MGAVQKMSKHCKLIVLTGEEFNMSFLPEGFKPEKVQDGEGSDIIKGAAIAELEKVERQTGEWPNGEPKDQYNFQWRIKSCVSGNAHPNRVVFKKYSMTDSEYSTGAENRAKLIKDLCTAGYDVDYSTEEAFHRTVPAAKGITANLRLSEFKEKQTVRVVEKFKEKSGSKKEAVTEALPF